MVYGHRREKDCDDIEMMTGLENRSKDIIIKAINAITPMGRTPLARSATLAITAVKEAGKAATIILITDGIESCDGDICEVVSATRLEGIDFKLHIVGFGLKEEETKVLRCAADAGGGRYFSAEDADQLSSVLQEVTSQTVDDLLENFSILALKNNEPVDATVGFTEISSGKGITGSRTYTSTTSNPREFILSPGEYQVKIVARGKHTSDHTDFSPEAELPKKMTSHDLDQHGIMSEAVELPKSEALNPQTDQQPPLPNQPTPDMGLGMFSPHLEIDLPLYFYGHPIEGGLPSDEDVVDSVTFHMDQYQNLAISTAPSWFVPVHEKVDYGFLLMKIRTVYPHTLEVEVNATNGRTALVSIESGNISFWRNLFLALIALNYWNRNRRR